MSDEARAATPGDVNSLPVSQALEEFPAEPSSVGDARRFVRRALVAWNAEEWEFAATTLVSELATNSVLHARTAFTVELQLDDQSLRLRVSDGSPVAPVVKSHSAQATTGRGLDLVAALSIAWGVEPRATGKAVWCVLNRSGALAGQPGPKLSTASAPKTTVEPRSSGRTAVSRAEQSWAV